MGLVVYIAIMSAIIGLLVQIIVGVGSKIEERRNEREQIRRDKERRGAEGRFARAAKTGEMPIVTASRILIEAGQAYNARVPDFALWAGVVAGGLAVGTTVVFTYSPSWSGIALMAISSAAAAIASGYVVSAVVWGVMLVPAMLGRLHSPVGFLVFLAVLLAMVAIGVLSPGAQD